MDRFEAMQTFVRVVEAGSFAAVAEQMQVARSVVTRQVAALEQRLKAKLLTRSTRSLSLTAAGAAYLEQCRTILGLVDAAASGMAEPEALGGRIRLGLPLSFGLGELMPAIMGFARQHPDVHLELHYADQRANLIEAGLDLTIRITGDLQASDIVRRLGRCRILAVASPAYLAARGTPRRPEDLARHDCLIYSLGPSRYRWNFQRGGQPVAVTVRPRMVADNGTALVQAAAQDLGVTVQPDFIVQPFLDSGQVVEILAGFERAPLGIFAVLPSNRYIPHRVSALMDHLQASVARGGRD